MGRRFSFSPQAEAMTPAELVELRLLKRELTRLLVKVAPLSHDVPAAEAARRLGFASTRTVLDLVRAGEFPGAWKPAPNRVHIPVAEIEAFRERRRVGR